ncbi:hypothetical protein GWI33_004024, partial [Rhynchophorus ferrugineus]
MFTIEISKLGGFLSLKSFLGVIIVIEYPFNCVSEGVAIFVPVVQQQEHFRHQQFTELRVCTTCRGAVGSVLANARPRQLRRRQLFSGREIVNESRRRFKLIHSSSTSTENEICVAQCPKSEWLCRRVGFLTDKLCNENRRY